MIDKKLLDKYKNTPANQKTVDRLFRNKHLTNDGHAQASALLKPKNYRLDILSQNFYFLSLSMLFMAIILFTVFELHIPLTYTFTILLSGCAISAFVFLYHDTNSMISKMSRLLFLISMGLTIYFINNAYYAYDMSTLLLIISTLYLPMLLISRHTLQLFITIQLLVYSLYKLLTFHVYEIYDDQYINLVYILLSTINMIYIVHAEKTDQRHKKSFIIFKWKHAKKFVIPVTAILLQTPALLYLFEISNNLKNNTDLSFLQNISMASFHENWLTSNLFYVLFMTCCFRYLYHFYHHEVKESIGLRVVIVALVLFLNTVLTIGVEYLFLEQQSGSEIVDFFQYYTSTKLLIILSITTFISFSIGVSLLRMVTHKLDSKEVTS